MQLLLIGLLLFLGIHLVPSVVVLRSYLIAKLGEKLYIGFYSIIALCGLVLIVVGKSKAGFQPVWTPPVWNNILVFLLMPFALILSAAANMPSNIKRFTRHPMLWGVFIWSISHLLANGDLASLLLFGGFAIFSLLAMISANLRGATKQTNQYPFSNDLKIVAAGLVVYLIFLFLHPYLFGANII